MVPTFSHGFRLVTTSNPNRLPADHYLSRSNPVPIHQPAADKYGLLFVFPEDHFMPLMNVKPELKHQEIKYQKS